MVFYSFILTYRNGGGAFLIPFAIMMGIIGIPLFYMEASLGQFTSRGPMTCWDFAPVFKGTTPSFTTNINNSKTRVKYIY